MTAFLPHDPGGPLRRGRTVIEASAGTGKTYAIASMVCSLVATDDLPIDRILVVTFTRAATAELRRRVRSRLVETHRALRIGDELGEDLRHLAGSAEVAAARVGDALAGFDRAQIFTIHGFAQRLLGALGFRSRLSPDLEPSAVDDLLIDQASSDLVVGRFAPADPTEGFLTPAEVADIVRAVVGAADAHIVPDVAGTEGIARTRVEMAHALRREVGRRLRLAGATTFDDALFEVAEAIADERVGEAARALLARRYAVALVDEAQDTDPLQWKVLRAVFDQSRLVVIGDPKQSIYSFRGADVESYLSAARGADERQTLSVNRRSDGPLLDALDVLFAGETFGDEGIHYRTVDPAEDRRQGGLRPAGPPLTFRSMSSELPIDRWAKGFLVDPLRRAVAGDVAAEVVRLLSAGVLRPDGIALDAGDVAVLCRTRKQVDMVRAELGRRSVPSVAARTGGVFLSEAARQWRLFLLGLERPDRIDLVKLAATTLLVGLSLAEVAALDDDAVLDQQQRLREWLELLRAEGVPGLLMALSIATDLPARVLSLPDGERIYTDLTHIAEEMHSVWRRGRVVSLVGWLEEAMAESARLENRFAEEPESRQRRLETDAAAVSVQTVHGAKGLEYPVVFVPYAWDVPARSPALPLYHDPEVIPGPEPRPRLIHVGGSGSLGFDDAVVAAVAEAAAEESRLLYVALTRARHQLTVWWVENSDNAPRSPLHRLLVGEGRSPEDLVARAAGNIVWVSVADLAPTDAYEATGVATVALEAARFDRPLDHAWRRASFSSLSPEHPLAPAPDTAEEARTADETAEDEPVEGVVAVADTGVGLPLADLPRGAMFGTLVHRIVERVPFGVPDLAAAVADLATEEMRSGSWDFDVSSLVPGLVVAMETPLGPDDDSVRLVDIHPDRQLAELTFEMPARPDGGLVALADVASVMLDHLDPADPYRAYARDLAVSDSPGFRGYLTGSIDLTTVLPDGRFVVMDYKTNALPTAGTKPRPEDYGPRPLAQAMIAGHYALQATIYQVALHRYLQWRLPDYRPASHLGGALYLFVRGMVGPATPVVEGERCGVARWAPPAAMVTDLSDLFAGGTA